MNSFLKKTIWISLIYLFFQIEKVQAIVPYYYFPSIKNLKKQSLYIGRNAYQLLYFGQYKDSINIESLNWDDTTWQENLKGTTLKRIKPWMWKRNIQANIKNKKVQI